MNIQIGDKIKLKINDDYCDEAKVDIRQLPDRIGKVVEANAHPNADKLIVLNVSIGDENRQLCAGLKEHYSLEEFVGKHIVGSPATRAASDEEVAAIMTAIFEKYKGGVQ